MRASKHAVASARVAMRVAALLCFVPVTVACDGGAGPDGDAGDSGHERGEGASGGEPRDGEPDRGSLPTESGPMTFVVDDAAFVVDRLCDLDGDGDEDNAIGDLGAGNASLFAMALNTLVQGSFSDGGILLVHLPWVADSSAPEGLDGDVLVVQGEDTDRPPDPTDDLTGDEAFFATPGFVDACGEPLFAIGEASLVAGSLEAGPGTIGYPVEKQLLAIRGATVRGRIAPQGGQLDLTLCGYFLLQDLGAIGAELLEGRTFLEAFLGGGAILGMPSVPGVAPDLDLDGDGLERVELDAEGYVVSCVDGDRTTIEGPDCWRDSRMADGLSIVFEMSGLGARLAGPSPSWQWHVSGECAEFPPAHSRWGPCPGEACERWETRSCDATCGSPGEETCLWDCSGWSSCVPRGASVAEASSCEELVLHGGASCGGDPLSAALVSGPYEVAGFVLGEPLTVGRGPVIVDALVEVERASSELPGHGWALAFYLGSEGPIVGSPGTELGVATERIGYVLQWRFHVGSDAADEADRVNVRASVGPDGEEGLIPLGGYSGPELSPSLDSSTAGAVVQRLRFVVHPDLPETAESELSVSALAVEDGRASALDVGCLGAGCPVPIVPGDVFQLGLTAATSSHDARVAVPLGGGPGFRVEVRGVCE